MKRAKSVQEIPLMAAAARLKLSRLRAYDAVLTGQLVGRQTETGRWLVRADSVEAIERERRAIGQPQAA